MHRVRGAESRGTPWKLAWPSTENVYRKETVSVALHGCTGPGSDSHLGTVCKMEFFFCQSLNEKR